MYMADIFVESSDLQIENIVNFLQISDRLATAGQPTIEQYSTIAAAGYQLVINLALTDSPNALVAEDSIARSLGLEYLQIPVVWDNPTLEDFQAFKNAMDANSASKIFVHCAANKRVSAFVYLCRIVRGVDALIARQDLTKIWMPNEIWQAFIDRVLAVTAVRSRENHQ
jgi:protein tyrosine phosphatase (PTP) superfamily phosphohydrolase (DUF442 family)